MRLGRAMRLLSSLLICFQAVTLTASSLALGLGASPGSAAVACTCVLGDHAGCPMHHPASSPRSKSACGCKSTTDSHAAIVTAIVGPNAILAQRIELETPRSTSTLNHESARRLPVPFSPLTVRPHAPRLPLRFLTTRRPGSSSRIERARSRFLIRMAARHGAGVVSTTW